MLEKKLVQKGNRLGFNSLSITYSNIIIVNTVTTVSDGRTEWEKENKSNAFDIILILDKKPWFIS